jgi:hypothetical protein
MRGATLVFVLSSMYLVQRGQVRCALKVDHADLTHPRHKPQVYLRGPSVPNQIFMFWKQGWDRAPEAAQVARESFELLNPSYTIHALGEIEAEKMTNRSKIIPNDIWTRMSIQAQSDVYRTLLLYLYGGIWADASLNCARPLIWIPQNLTDLFSFQRYDNIQEQTEKRIKPWITSWFLVSPPRGKIIEGVFRVISDPLQHHRFFAEYFWLHRIVSELCQHDQTINATVSHYLSAASSHCQTSNYWADAPIFKRCASKRFASLVPKAKYCCNQSNLIKEAYCSTWNCSTISMNWKD